MTGIEAVGIVLGALPLVIQAVNWYHDGVGPLQDYWNYGPSLQLMQGRLNFQATIYEDSIRRLLIASGASAEEIHALLDPVDEPWRVTSAWKDVELEARLLRTLGQRHFDSFIFAVQQIEAIMQKLMGKLKLDLKGKPRWLPKGVPVSSVSISELLHRAQYEWRRISNTFSQGKQEKLIDQFKEYNNVIAAFVLNKEILAPHAEIMDAKSFVQYFDLIRKEACSLYELLAERWDCSCEHPHSAYLQLSFCGATKTSPVFDVLFSYLLNENPSQPWRKISIQPGPRSGQLDDSHDLLCSMLQDISQNEEHDKILFTSLDWQIKSKVKESLALQKSTVLQLKSLLKRDPKRSRRQMHLSGLSEKQRRQIALSLSYSILQFYDSPWMNEVWGEEDIHFLATVHDGNKLDISDPHFSRSFPQEGQEALHRDSSHAISSHFLDAHIPNKPLFALGIILLELCLNMTFDDLHDISSVDSGEVDATKKYQIVMENLDRAFDEWGDGFGRVVQRCINPEFGIRPSEKRLDFDKFRCLVYEGIVAPLEQDLKPFI
ncbi:hypothetical protein BP6252_10889 [Coleophoma cylindrospora]|uniref:DUF7580 domain-containing protein n=1 Tax=Coleophoma cylindrospora TaxID=1849047 RepID=A0A3D8QPG9_9HELO|nr:hypothetical protein BP6252_10889 [Coleophoma cylindrospora]